MIYTRLDQVRHEKIGHEMPSGTIFRGRVALEAGALGERIRVRNVSSQAVIEAEVLGPGAVRVMPDTAPITAQARNGARGG